MAQDIDQVVSEHVRRHIGEPSRVLHELIPVGGLHIDVLIVEPTRARPFYTLVTAGMSRTPMAIPENMEGQVCPHLELLLCLPSDWPLDDEALASEQWGWPVGWLRFLARFPHQFDNWLWVSHTLPNGEDCDPFAPGTGTCCWYVRIPGTIPEQSCELTLGDRTIVFLAPTAIYRAEMEFALSGGQDTLYALDQALAAAGINELIQPTRAELTAAQMQRHRGKLPT